MTKTEAVREFKATFIGLYINRADYWTAQEAWAWFTDSLCKEGRITPKQYASWSTPFPEGKPLRATRRQLETAIN